MQMMIRKIYYRLLIIKLACRWVFAYNLGDIVIHEGHRWIIVQGAAAPKWDLVRLNNEYRKNYVHEREFRKEASLKNYVRSFRSGYAFYTGFWLSLWIKNGIQPWMRGLDIWKKKTQR